MSINAAEFKAKCLQLMNQVADTREPLIISKRGKPLVRLVPLENEAPISLFGYMQGTGQILGDIVNVPHEPWAVETGEENDLYAAFSPKAEIKSDET
jgi:prevent-host-death family protein